MVTARHLTMHNKDLVAFVKSHVAILNSDPFLALRHIEFPVQAERVIGIVVLSIRPISHCLAHVPRQKQLPMCALGGSTSMHVILL